MSPGTEWRPPPQVTPHGRSSRESFDAPEDWTRPQNCQDVFRWMQIQVERENRSPGSRFLLRGPSLYRIRGVSQAHAITLLLPNDSAQPVLSASRAAIRPPCPTVLAHSICPACASYWQSPCVSFFRHSRSPSDARTSVNLTHPIAAPHSESNRYSCRASPTHLAGSIPRLAIPPRPSIPASSTLVSRLCSTLGFVPPHPAARLRVALSYLLLRSRAAGRALLIPATPPAPISPLSPCFLRQPSSVYSRHPTLRPPPLYTSQSRKRVPQTAFVRPESRRRDFIRAAHSIASLEASSPHTSK